VIGGVERKIHFFCDGTCRTPTRSSWWRIRPRRQKRFCDGHVESVRPSSTACRGRSSTTNTKIRGRPHSRRWQASADAACFSELQSHYLFTDRFWPPWQGQRQGEGRGGSSVTRGGTSLCRFPCSADFEALNAQSFGQLPESVWADRLRGHDGTIGDRLEREPCRLPDAACRHPTTACDKKAGDASARLFARALSVQRTTRCRRPTGT